LLQNNKAGQVNSATVKQQPQPQQAFTTVVLNNF